MQADRQVRRNRQDLTWRQSAHVTIGASGLLPVCPPHSAHLDPPNVYIYLSMVRLGGNAGVNEMIKHVILWKLKDEVADKVAVMGGNIRC